MEHVNLTTKSQRIAVNGRNRLMRLTMASGGCCLDMGDAEMYGLSCGCLGK